ncbi:MAG TPA: redoxin domain-containing protein [Candidatus Dormibacteraeota bacterium]|nr:redoxin domain-containing protein [Candidatus Dormibacteraeota bacterium]
MASSRCWPPSTSSTSGSSASTVTPDRLPPRTISRLLLFIALAIVATGCSLQHPIQQQNQSLATVGQAAPDFSGTDLDGKPISLSQFKGKPVVLNFWASWCGPCRAEQPALLNIVRDYQPRGVQVVGITVRDNLDQARIYRDEFKVPYPSLFDQAARLAYAYEVDAPPSSVFIDRNGIVQFKVPGQVSEDSFRRIIDDKLLSR